MDTVSVGDVTIAYDDDGGDGPPVVMICGTGMPASLYDLTSRPFLRSLGYRTITFENRGVPPSSVPPPPYTVEDMAGDTIGLLEHLDLGPCHVFGSSLGANIARTVALQRPDLVRSAVMNVGGTRLRYAARLGLQTVLAALEAGGEGARLSNRDTLLEASLTPETRMDEEAIRGVLALLNGMMEPADWDGLRGQMTANQAFSEVERDEELTGMQVPCLFLANGSDAFFAPEDIRAAAEAVPDGRFVLVPDAPHISLSPETAAVIRPAIEQFLAAN